MLLWNSFHEVYIKYFVTSYFMSEEGGITFETIRKIHIEEKTFDKLAKIPSDFYSKAKEYLEKKKLLVEKNKEIKNVENMIENIFEMRETKILTHAKISARTKMPPENLTPEEEEFFNQIVQMITDRRSNVISNVFKQDDAKKMVKAVFKDDVTEFVGSDMKSYGPFKAENKAEIPEENFKILSRRNIVEEVIE